MGQVCTVRVCKDASSLMQAVRCEFADLEDRANNLRKANLLGQQDGRLLAVLVREFLDWTHMNYALKVAQHNSQH